MAARVPVDDIPDVHLAYTVFLCQQPIVPGCLGTDSRNDIDGDLERAVSLSDISPPLRMHVTNVVAVRAEEQMPRVAAGWIVTPMADKKTIWYGAKCQFIHDAVRLLASVLKRKTAVAFRSAAAPFPAGVPPSRAVDTGPKLAQSLLSEFLRLKSLFHRHHRGPLSVHRTVTIKTACVNG